MTSQFERPTRFIIARHAESVANEKKLLAGAASNPPLTTRGEKDAREKGEALQQIVPIQVVFSSDLQRAERTAALIASVTEDKVIKTPHLRERDYGEFEGQPASELIDFWKTPYTERLDISFKDMEPDRNLVKRWEMFFEENEEIYEGKTSLVVTHADMIATYLGNVGETHITDIENTAYFIMEGQKGSQMEELKIIKSSGIIFKKAA